MEDLNISQEQEDFEDWNKKNKLLSNLNNKNKKLLNNWNKFL